MKIDIVTGESWFWTPPSAACGEPIFVQDPDGTAEDHGVLLSVVLDNLEEKSFMVVIDAASMSEVARAAVPRPIPLGFHGQYMGENFARGPEI